MRPATLALAAAALLPAIQGGAAPSPAAPGLTCRPTAQQSCTATACEPQQPPTELQLDLAANGAHPVLCYGSTCWTTRWSRVDRPDPARMVLTLSGEAAINGTRQQVSVQASIGLAAGHPFLLSVSDDPASTQLFAGACAPAQPRGTR